MKSFKFNRKKEDLLPVMKAKAEKANIKMTKEKDKISLMLETGKFQNGEDAVPVIFKGKITNTETGCIFDGKYTYGFYLYTFGYSCSNSYSCKIFLVSISTSDG